jgi:hypothetical protein
MPAPVIIPFASNWTKVFERSAFRSPDHEVANASGSTSSADETDLLPSQWLHSWDARNPGGGGGNRRLLLNVVFEGAALGAEISQKFERDRHSIAISPR